MKELAVKRRLASAVTFAGDAFVQVLLDSEIVWKVCRFFLKRREHRLRKALVDAGGADHER